MSARFGIILAVVVPACLGPTEITVQISSDDCGALTETRIAVGSSFATTQGCQGPSVVGSIVVVPSHTLDDLVDIEVVGGLGKDPTTCTSGDPQCIVARRSLHYIEHTPLALPIALEHACAGVACDDPSTTCSRGACVPSAVVCAAGSCTLGATDAGVDASADVMVPDAPPAEAGTVLTALATGQGMPKGIYVDATDVYWTNAADPGGSVMKCATSGCTNPTVVASNQPGAESIAGDSTNVYWSTYITGGQVALAPKSGGATVPLATGLASAFDVATSSGGVYWTNNSDGTVTTCAATGCNNTPVVIASSQSGPSGIAVDSTRVYWADAYSGDVTSCALPSCTAPTLVASGQKYPERIIVDGTDVYWTNFTGGSVMKCAAATSCTSPTTIASGQLNALGIAVDATSVYWTTAGTNGTVMKCAKSGCVSPTVLVQGQKTPWAVAVDATSVYWTNRDDGTVMKLTPK